MKTLLVILLALGVTASASAQKVIRGGGHYRAVPRVSVGVGLGYNPYYYGSAFGPWGYPYYNNFGYRHPSRLDMETQDIRNVYQAKIRAARSDKSVPRSERRQNIKQLKVDREQEIADARKAYYAPRTSRAPRNYDN